MNTENEILLVERWKKGDESSLKTLVERYRHKAFNFVFYLSGCDRDTTYGITVEAFVQASRRIFSNASGHFFTEVLRYAVELCQRTHPTFFEDASLFLNIPPSSRAMLRVVQEALGALSFEHRSFLLLRDQLYLPYEEISLVLDLSVKETRLRTVQARFQLRNQVEERLGHLKGTL